MSRPCLSHAAEQMPAPRFPTARPLALAVHLIVFGGAFALAAHAPEAFAQSSPQATATRAYDIPAGPLSSALVRFAREAGVSLVGASNAADGKSSPGLKGSYTVQGGFAALLAGSGLEAFRQADGSYGLRPAPVVDKSGEITLTPVTVTANNSQENAWGAVKGYVAKRSATGTKTDTPIIETPQSISVVSAEQVETIKAQNLTDALGYVAGLNRLEGTDRTTDAFMLRGFRAFSDDGNLYRDGSKYTLNAYNGQQELYGLERIEYLKGASSVLYGTSAPGGIINTVTKRPTDETLRELNFEVGSFDRKQISGDFSGRFSPESDWSYRLTFLNRDSDTFTDYVKDDRTFIAPALKWQPNAQTSFTLLGEYQRDRTNYVYGLPTEGTILPNQNGRIARDLFVGEKSDKSDYNDVDRGSLGYLFEHAFDENTKLRHSLRYMQGKTDRSFTWVWGLSADQRNPVMRVVSGIAEDYDMATSDTSLEHRWAMGNMENTTLVGVDYTYQDYKKTQWDRDITGTFDYFNPTYGNAIGDRYNFRNQRDKSNRVGLYAQNQAKIDNRWVVLLGGRQDWSRGDHLAFFKSEATKDRTDAFTGRAGLVYLADNGLAPYISYSQSFEPTVGFDRTGTRFNPTEGEQYEAGIRYQPKGRDVLLTAAVYQLTRTNVTVTDPVDINFSVQQGEVRSRGLELEARTRIGRHANLIAAYAYTDARTLKSSPLTPEKEGKRTSAVPFHSFSLWSDYEFGAFGLPGLKAGIGARYVGSTEALNITGTVPSYTVFDAMASYTTGPWKFALNATNLTDKNYVVSCTYGCFYGEPRKIIGSVSYRW